MSVQTADVSPYSFFHPEHAAQHNIEDAVISSGYSQSEFDDFDDAECDTIILPNFYHIRLTRKKIKRIRKSRSLIPYMDFSYSELWNIKPRMLKKLDSWVEALTKINVKIPDIKVPALVPIHIPTDRPVPICRSIKKPFSYSEIIFRLNIPVLPVPTNKPITINIKLKPEKPAKPAPVKPFYKYPDFAHYASSEFYDPTEISHELRYPDYTNFAFSEFKEEVEKEELQYPDFSNPEVPSFFRQTENHEIIVDRDLQYPDYSLYY